APQTFDLAPATFGISSVGELAFVQPAGSDNTWFRIDGGFFLQINSTGLSAFGTGELLIGSGGSTPIFDFHTTALFIANNVGLAGFLDIGLDAGSQTSGFSVSGAFTVEMNTTGATQSLTLPQSMVAVLTAEQKAALGIGSNNKVGVPGAAPPPPSG